MASSEQYSYSMGLVMDWNQGASVCFYTSSWHVSMSPPIALPFFCAGD